MLLQHRLARINIWKRSAFRHLCPCTSLRWCPWSCRSFCSLRMQITRHLFNSLCVLNIFNDTEGQVFACTTVRNSTNPEITRKSNKMFIFERHAVFPQAEHHESTKQCRNLLFIQLILCFSHWLFWMSGLEHSCSDSFCSYSKYQKGTWGKGMHHTCWYLQEYSEEILLSVCLLIVMPQSTAQHFSATADKIDSSDLRKNPQTLDYKAC